MITKAFMQKKNLSTIWGGLRTRAIQAGGQQCQCFQGHWHIPVSSCWFVGKVCGANVHRRAGQELGSTTRVERVRTAWIFTNHNGNSLVFLPTTVVLIFIR
jgi:hypothetical protein